MEEIVKVAALLFGQESQIYRVFLDTIKIPHLKFAHFIATFVLVCRMNQNLNKVWEDDEL